jgi:aromatic-L-amino-acid/L-tryptophan decarboxylase
MANFMSVLTARRWYEDRHERERVIGEVGQDDNAEMEEERSPAYVVYTSIGAHRCIQQAVVMSGIQSGAGRSKTNQRTAGLRKIPVHAADHRMNLSLLEAEIVADLAAGLTPLLIVATAGTVDVGAIDDLPAIAHLCERFQLWFHVDGAYGALGVLSTHVRPLLSGLELANSIAFDFHKWGQVRPPSSLDPDCSRSLMDRCSMTQGC